MPILQKLSHWSRDRKNNVPVDKPERLLDDDRLSQKPSPTKAASNEKIHGAVQQRSLASKSDQAQPSSTPSLPKDKQLRKKLSKIRPPSHQQNNETPQQWSEDPFLNLQDHQQSKNFNKPRISIEQQGSNTNDLSRNYSLPRRIIITSISSPRTSADTMSSEYSGLSVETALTTPSSILSCHEVSTPPPTQKRGRSICIKSSLDDEPREVLIPIAHLVPAPITQPRSRSMPRSHSRWNHSISSTNATPSYSLFPPRPSTSNANRSDLKANYTAGGLPSSPKRSTRHRSSTAGEHDRSNDSWNQYFEQYPTQLMWSLEPPSPPPTRALPPIPPMPPLHLPKRPATSQGTSPSISHQNLSSHPKPSTRSRANSSTHTRTSSHSRKLSMSVLQNGNDTSFLPNHKILLLSPQMSTGPVIPLRRSRSVSHTGLSRPQYLSNNTLPPVPSLQVAPLRIRSASNMKAAVEAQSREQKLPIPAPLPYSQYSSANLI